MSFEWARSVPRCVVARVARARARARCCSVRWRAVACIVVMAGDPFGGLLTFLTIAHIAAGAPLGVSGAPCRVTERSGVDLGEHSTQCSGSIGGAGALDVDQGGSVLLVLLLVGNLQRAVDVDQSTGRDASVIEIQGGGQVRMGLGGVLTGTPCGCAGRGSYGATVCAWT